MNEFVILFFLLGLVTTVLSLPSIQKCHLDDATCISQSASKTLKQILLGIPELGIESSEPLFLKEINNEVANLKYNFYNVTIDGFSNCDLENLKWDLIKNRLHYDLYCKLVTYGDYGISGRLLILPVEGNGKYSIKLKKILLSVDADLKQTEVEEKKYISINKFKIDNLDAIDQVIFNFQNLFNGNKQLSDGVHKFANTSYKEVTKELSGPIFLATLKKITKNVNKYLKAVPIEDLFLS